MLRMLWALSLRSSTGLQTTAKPNTELCWARGEPGDQKSKQDRTITVSCKMPEKNGLHRDPRRAGKLADVNLEDQSMPVSQTCECSCSSNVKTQRITTLSCVLHCFFQEVPFCRQGLEGKQRPSLGHGYCIRWFLRHSSSTSRAPRAACEVDWSKTLTSVGNVKELGAMLAWGNSTECRCPATQP